MHNFAELEREKFTFVGSHLMKFHETKTNHSFFRFMTNYNAGHPLKPVLVGIFFFLFKIKILPYIGILFQTA